jgi:DNA polymerase-3 subunit epsilon
VWKWLARTFADVEPPSSPARAAVPDVPRLASTPPRAARLPEFVVAVDVETTGFHSTDRIVSLGAVWLPTACLAERCFPVSYMHLVFDPGKKSHPRAEHVHGHHDWVLRHQEPFAAYAGKVRDFLESGDLLIAHNADFDFTFIDRELAAAGERPVSKPVYCTMAGYRSSGLGGSAALRSICASIGLRPEGARHGALEDAWLSLMVFLQLHGHDHAAPFTACGEHRELFNLCPAPPMPAGPLRRRRRTKPR